MERNSQKRKRNKGKELLDYNHEELMSKNEEQVKKKKKIISGIKKNLRRNHTFHYLTRHIGKGERDSIKRIHIVDKNQKFKAHMLIEIQ